MSSIPPFVPDWKQVGNPYWQEPSYGVRPDQPFSPPPLRGVGLTEQIPGGNPEAPTPLDAIFGLGLSGMSSFLAGRGSVPRSAPEVTQEAASSGGGDRRDFLKKFAGAALGVAAGGKLLGEGGSAAAAPAAAEIPPITWAPYGYKYGLIAPVIPKGHPWEQFNGKLLEIIPDSELPPSHPLTQLLRQEHAKRNAVYELKRSMWERERQARLQQERDSSVTDQAEGNWKAPEGSMEGPGRPMKKLSQPEKQKMGYKKAADYDGARSADREARQISKEELDALVRAMMEAYPNGDPTMKMLGAPVRYGK